MVKRMPDNKIARVDGEDTDQLADNEDNEFTRWRRTRKQEVRRGRLLFWLKNTSWTGGDEWSLWWLVYSDCWRLHKEWVAEIPWKLYTHMHTQNSIQLWLMPNMFLLIIFYFLHKTYLNFVSIMQNLTWGWYRVQ